MSSNFDKEGFNQLIVLVDPIEDYLCLKKKNWGWSLVNLKTPTLVFSTKRSFTNFTESVTVVKSLFSSYYLTLVSSLDHIKMGLL